VWCCCSLPSSSALTLQDFKQACQKFRRIASLLKLYRIKAYWISRRQLWRDVLMWMSPPLSQFVLTAWRHRRNKPCAASWPTRNAPWIARTKQRGSWASTSLRLQLHVVTVWGKVSRKVPWNFDKRFGQEFLSLTPSWNFGDKQAVEPVWMSFLLGWRNCLAVSRVEVSWNFSCNFYETFSRTITTCIRSLKRREVMWIRRQTFLLIFYNSSISGKQINPFADGTCWHRERTRWPSSSLFSLAIFLGRERISRRAARRMIVFHPRSNAENGQKSNRAGYFSGASKCRLSARGCWVCFLAS